MAGERFTPAPAEQASFRAPVTINKFGYQNPILDAYYREQNPILDAYENGRVIEQQFSSEKLQLLDYIRLFGGLSAYDRLITPRTVDPERTYIASHELNHVAAAWGEGISVQFVSFHVRRPTLAVTRLKGIHSLFSFVTVAAAGAVDTPNGSAWGWQGGDYPAVAAVAELFGLDPDSVFDTYKKHAQQQINRIFQDDDIRSKVAEMIAEKGFASEWTIMKFWAIAELEKSIEKLNLKREEVEQYLEAMQEEPLDEPSASHSLLFTFDKPEDMEELEEFTDIIDNEDGSTGAHQVQNNVIVGEERYCPVCKVRNARCNQAIHGAVEKRGEKKRISLLHQGVIFIRK